MLKILLAYRSYSLDETPKMLYIGHDGEALDEIRAKIGPEIVRATMISGATEFPVSLPAPGAKQESDSSQPDHDVESILTASEKPKSGSRK